MPVALATGFLFGKWLVLLRIVAALEGRAIVVTGTSLIVAGLVICGGPAQARLAAVFLVENLVAVLNYCQARFYIVKFGR